MVEWLIFTYRNLSMLELRIYPSRENFSFDSERPYGMLSTQNYIRFVSQLGVSRVTQVVLIQTWTCMKSDLWWQILTEDMVSPSLNHVKREKAVCSLYPYHPPLPPKCLLDHLFPEDKTPPTTSQGLALWRNLISNFPPGKGPRSGLLGLHKDHIFNAGLMSDTPSAWFLPGHMRESLMVWICAFHCTSLKAGYASSYLRNLEFPGPSKVYLWT